MSVRIGTLLLYAIGGGFMTLCALSLWSAALYVKNGFGEVVVWERILGCAGVAALFFIAAGVQ